jgi:hypothetical protein
VRTCAGNEKMARDAIISWTPGQVTRVCDPRPKFGAGSRSLGDLAPGNTIGVSMFLVSALLAPPVLTIANISRVGL